MNAELIEKLACPRCRGQVELQQDARVVACNGCGLRYPVRDGLPMMLVDEAEQGPVPTATTGTAPASTPDPTTAPETATTETT